MAGHRRWLKTPPATAKYSGADGALLWEQYYNGPNNSAEGMPGSGCLAVGPNGMVAVTGSSGTGGGFTTVVYQETLSSISIVIEFSDVRLSFSGTPGKLYKVERAPSCTGPWEVIATPVVPTSGFVEYIDADRPHGSAFYRTRTP